MCEIEQVPNIFDIVGCFFTWWCYFINALFVLHVHLVVMRCVPARSVSAGSMRSIALDVTDNLKHPIRSTLTSPYAGLRYSTNHGVEPK